MLKRRLAAALLGLTVIVLLVLLRAADPYPVQAARETAFDLFQRSAPRPAADYPVRVVDIDEASLAEIGQWPWPRDVFATLTSRLAEMGAAVVAYDVLFPEPDRLSPSRIAERLGDLPDALSADDEVLPDFDAEFAAALVATPTVLGFSIAPGSSVMPERPKASLAISGEDPTAAIPRMPGAVLPIPLLADAATGLGAFSLNSADSVGVVRRLPLVWSNGTTLFPSLSIEALRVAMGIETVVVLGEVGGGGYVEGLRIGDLTVPTTPTGDIWLRYRPHAQDLYLSARTVLGPDHMASAPLVAGQIVFVGASASGLNDLRGTPLGENVPGVSIHAQVIEQILAQDFLWRTDWMAGLEIVAVMVIGLLLIIVVQWAGPWIGLMFGGAVVAGVAWFCWWMFTARGLLIDPSFPLAATVLTYSAMVFFRFLTTDAERRQIRRAFGHYVDKSLLAEIERNSGLLKLGGDVRELSIMFTDVRDFTPLSQSVDPRSLVTMLNTLFEALGSEITKRFGTIDKFVGDAIMAFWNAPVDVDNHAEKACAAALGMRQALRRLNEADGFGLRTSGHARKEIAIGIGISTGEALVGNMGLESRFAYSCAGHTVNLAARVEGACKTVSYDILVTEGTRLQAPQFATLQAGAIALKGMDAPAVIHLLVGDEVLAVDEAFAALREKHLTLIEKLRAGRRAPALIRQCVALAAPIDARLAGFYALVAERADDFLPKGPALEVSQQDVA